MKPLRVKIMSCSGHTPPVDPNWILLNSSPGMSILFSSPPFGWSAEIHVLRKLRSLEAWLCEATRFASARAVRSEHRRFVREQAAILMEVNSSESTSADSARDWERIAPVLGEAIEKLHR
jgi:hypothetical protein